MARPTSAACKWVWCVKTLTRTATAPPLGPPLGAPSWILPWFAIAGIIGFPFWVAFAWFYEFTPQGLQVGDDRRAADAALQKFIKLYHDGSAYQIAVLYAVRKDPDDMFKWLGRAWDNRDPGLQDLWRTALLKPWRRDPRFVAFAKKIGLPAPDQKVPAAGSSAAVPASASTAR